MFKEEVYNFIITTLNLNTQSMVFDGGYDIVFYRDPVGNPIPYVIDTSSTSSYDYAREEIIPVSEEYNNETPSVNGSDRSDYVAQYQVMVRIENLPAVKVALTEFRDYLYANKQHTIDGYKVGFKTTRGDKQASVRLEGGNIYCFYKISVYFMAIKNGYIYKDADTVSIRLKDTGSYVPLTITDEVTGNAGNPIMSDSSGKSKGELTTMTLNTTIRFYYNSTAMEKLIYAQIQNKGPKNQLFDIRTIFDGITYDYVAIISGGGKTKSPNGAALFEFNWMEADE